MRADARKDSSPRCATLAPEAATPEPETSEREERGDNDDYDETRPAKVSAAALATGRFEVGDDSNENERLRRRQLHKTAVDFADGRNRNVAPTQTQTQTQTRTQRTNKPIGDVCIDPMCTAQPNNIRREHTRPANRTRLSTDASDGPDEADKSEYDDYESVKDAAASNRVDSDIRSIILGNNELVAQLQRSIANSLALFESTNRVTSSDRAKRSSRRPSKQNAHRISRQEAPNDGPTTGPRAANVDANTDVEAGVDVDADANYAKTSGSLRALVSETMDFNTDKKMLDYIGRDSRLRPSSHAADTLSDGTKITFKSTVR